MSCVSLSTAAKVAVPCTILIVLLVDDTAVVFVGSFDVNVAIFEVTGRGVRGYIG